MEPTRLERKLTAILSADVKGYSRLMGEDEVATIRILTAYRNLMTSLIQQHRGRVVDTPGDNLLAPVLLVQEGKNQKAKDKNVYASEAETCFHKAIGITQKQSAKSLELRAVMSLSRLWQQQGKTKEARQMLAEVYDWFTEGFDTANLKEAKALLEELS